MNLKYTLLSLSVISFLSACGGSSGGSDTNPDPVQETTSLTGKVADGYLQGAKVCLDLNQDKICNDDEPSTESTAGGNFTLEGVTQEQIDSTPLLVEIIAGETIDEDEPDVPIAKAYKLTAPAGFTFVSPLSTMVQNEVEKGEELASAKQLIQNKLGTNLDLNTDYVAGKNDESAAPEQKAEMEKLHKVAQVTARVISDNMSQLEEAANTAEIPVDELISAIVDEVILALDDITTQIELIQEDSSQDFDADLLANDIDEEFIELEGDKLKEQLEQKTAENNASAANLVALVTGGGINWLWSEMEDEGPALDYGTLSLDELNQTQDIEYMWQDMQWVMKGEDEYDDDMEMVLTSDGWKSYDDSVETVTLNDDNSITISFPEAPQLSQTLRAEQFPLEGLNASLILSQSSGDGTWSHAVPSTATFPADALGFKLHFTQDETQYVFSDWGGCEEEDKIGGLCNSIWMQDANSSNEDNSGPALSFESFIVDSPVELDSESPDPMSLTGLYLGWSENEGNLFAEFISTGMINFYRIKYHNDGSNDVYLLTTGKWETQSVHEVEIMHIMAPDFLGALEGFGDFFEHKEQRFLFEHLGAVRVGEIQGGESEEGNVVFNQVAMDFILQQFDPSLIPSDTSKNPDENTDSPTEPTKPNDTSLCELGDSQWDEQLEQPVSSTLKTATEYNAAISSCLDGNSEIFWTSDTVESLVLHTVEDDEVGKFTFSSGGMGTYSNSEESIDFNWTIENQRLVLKVINSEGEQEISLTFAILYEDEMGYISVKHYEWNGEWGVETQLGEVWTTTYKVEKILN